MLYWAHFVVTIAVIPWAILHFCDESHFYPGPLFLIESLVAHEFIVMVFMFASDLHRAYGWAESGRRIRLAGRSGGDDRFSQTVVTDLRSPDGFHCSEPRVASNTALDFLLFVIDIIERGVSGLGF